jgi:hypothetical protein
MSRAPFSPPPTASTNNPSYAQQQFITHKSHRLRTSPVAGEGSTFVPVVKFSQSFTQRNALQGAKPIYGTANVEQPLEGDIVSIQRGANRKSHGWTISITSSSHTDDDLQVEVQQHFEPESQHQQQQRQQQQRSTQTRSHGLPGGAGPRSTPDVVQPRLPPPLTLIPPPPTLGHDRLVITEEDLSRLRVKCISVLILGILFPPLWLLMGWGHTLDGMILPSTVSQHQQQIQETYRPYRRVAAVLAGIVVLGTFVGIIIGGLALGGII